MPTLPTPLASNPITIGELTDVPAPQSPINAQFHQEVANRITHRFATVAQMNAWAAGNGSLAYNAETQRVYERIAGAWYEIALQSTLSNVSTVANAAAQGLIASASISADKTGIGSTPTLVTGCQVTWTADPSRFYRIRAAVPCMDNTAGGTVSLYIADGSNNQLSLATANTPGSVIKSQGVVEMITSGLSGSTTRRLLASIPQGTLSIYYGAGGITAASISVFDEGS